MGCVSSSLVLEGISIDANAAPPDEDSRLHEQNARILTEGDSILETLQTYESCSDVCRKAIGEPTSKNRWIALEAVTKTVIDVNNYFKHGDIISEAIIEIIKRLISDISPDQSRINPTQDIKFNDHSALIMQLASFFSFITKFDNLKSLNAAIQNDLSMFRRMIQVSSKPSDENLNDPDAVEYSEKLASWLRPEELDPDTVSALSFFIASPIPIHAQLVTKLIDFAAEDIRVDAVLPHIANLFLLVVSNKQFGDTSERYTPFLEAMACAIIIYDRVEPEGVFHSKSPVQVLNAITLLKKAKQMFPNSKEKETEHLLNGLRYWTVHLQDATTPNAITKKLDM